MLVKKRKIVVGLLLYLAICLINTYPAWAGTPKTYISQIKINGADVYLNPPAFISESRTLVPVSFIVLNNALQGQVYWDAGQSKVALDCRSHYMEFYIGRRQASVDGRKLAMDVAPAIWRDRTYIPLSFLVQNLGGQVAWNRSDGSISVNFEAVDTNDSINGVVPTTPTPDTISDAEPPAAAGTNENPDRVFAYYYYSPQAELQANGYLFSDIAFRWFAADGSGDLSYEYKDDYAAKLQWARQQGIATHASVVLMDQDELHQLLSNSTNRWHLIQQLVATAWRDNYDGIDIDFEFIASRDAALFSQFLRDLKDSLGSEKTLSVAVMARTGAETWNTGYDYRAIGEIADLVVVMAYDYSYIDSSPGPIAPYWWVEQVVDYTASQMPREKILLGMATYGYDWIKTGSAKTVTAKTLKQIQSSYKVKEYFDQPSMSPYYTYYDDQGVYHQVWMENRQSLTAKWNLCREQNLGGISFWRIGTGFTDLYQLLASQIISK